MGLPLETYQYYDNGGGLDLKSSPTKGQEDEATLSLNVDYSTDGAFLTRNGSSIVNVSGGIPSQMPGAPRTLLIFPYRKSDGTSVDIVCAGTAIKHSLTAPTDAVTGLSGALPIPDIEFFVTNEDEYAFWGNGIDENLKFNGTWSNWSIAQPSNPSAVDNGAGSLGAGQYRYHVSFARTVLGVIVDESALNAVPASVTIGASRQIRVTIPVSSDPQVNARVLYRQSPTSSGIYYRLAVIADNTTTTYDDNTAANGTIEADFDNRAAPKTAIFEEYQGEMWMVDAARPTDVYVSKPGRPGNVPLENLTILDGPVKCIRRLFGALILGTDRSIWVQNGSWASGAEPKRISSTIGILNNRCAVGEDYLKILATNRKFYTISPTDFSQSEMRLDEPLSEKIDDLFNQINKAALDQVCMESLTTANEAKIFISVPIGAPNNSGLIVYNESQSRVKGKPVWQRWNNINASALRSITTNGETNLYSGDFNGFLWKLNDTSKNGDGAEDNGTATAATASTITDSTKTWTVNAFVGMKVRIIDGTGVDQVRTITANTATQLTVSPNWTQTPDATSLYTVGGYDAYHFTNWKSVTGSYDAVKQLWFIFSNLNASGDYTIELIIQFDFNQNLVDSEILNISLAAQNTIWGSFIWGEAVWGAYSVFQDRVRKYGRFKAVRFGFRNRKAGQPFQVNGFSVSVQDKKLFYRGAA